MLSTAKQLLLDPPYYVYSAFEQGNGAAMELGGPMPFLNPGLMRYRVFFGGGSGRFAGNVGGRYFTYDNTNYTYSVGAQVGIILSVTFPAGILLFFTRQPLQLWVFRWA